MKKNIISKVLSIVLVCVMLITSMGAYSGNVASAEENFDLSKYNRYTYASNVQLQQYSNSLDILNIDLVIEYVKSLQLSKIGYTYIEEACLKELSDYKDAGIALESYTVLVPKTRAKQYFGTYGGKDYYYEYTSEANFRDDVIGEKKNSSTESKWNNWMLGVINIGLSFADWQVSLPFSIISSIIGNTSTSSIAYNAYNHYVLQYTNIVTKIIYRESSANRFVVGYRKQAGNVQAKLYFCPIGSGFDSDFIFIETIFDKYFDTTLTSLSDAELMATISRMIDRGGQLVANLSSYTIRESW